MAEDAFGQRQVGDDLMAVGVDAHLHLGAAHPGGAVGDVGEPVEVGLGVGVGVGPHVVPGLGGRRYDVGLAAAVGDDVVDAAGLLDVLAHVVGADVHQLDAVQRAAALVRAGRGVRR